MGMKLRRRTMPELRDAIDKALAEVEVEDRERIIENSENG
jgi:hypothetical protein